MNNYVRKLITSGLLIAMGVFILPGIAVAQQYYDPGILQKTIDRKPVGYQPIPIRLGSFILSPGAELAYENKDNIFYRGNSNISDNITHIRPWANLKSDWNRHAMNFNFYADIGRYSDYGTEDYEDWVASLDGRVDVKRGSNFNYKASYMQLHEDRSSPDDVRGVRPTEFSLSGFDVGYSHNFNRVTAAFSYKRADTNYDNNVNASGDILDNQDRDRIRDTLGLRLNWERSGRRGIFFSVAGNQLDYDQQFDNNGFARSSDGFSFQSGVSWDKTGVLVGDLYIEYTRQKYEDLRLPNVEGFGIGAKLDWTPTKLTNINLRISNGPQETTQGSTSGYFSNLYSVRLQHELRRNLLINARASYTNNNYEFVGTGTGSLTDTQVTRAGAGLSYLFNRNIYISGGYVYERQDANTAVFEYTANRWFLTLGAEL